MATAARSAGSSRSRGTSTTGTSGKGKGSPVKKAVQEPAAVKKPVAKKATQKPTTKNAPARNTSAGKPGSRGTKPAVNKTVKQSAKPTAKKTARKPGTKPAAPTKAKPTKTTKVTASRAQARPTAARRQTQTPLHAPTIVKAGNGASTAGNGTAVRLSVSPPTRAMYDALCDGRWHDREEILTLGAVTCTKEQYAKAVEEGKRVRKGRPASTNEYLESGGRQIARNNLRIAVRNNRIVEDNRGRLRMPAALARQWRRDRSAEETSKIDQGTKSGKPQVLRQRFGEEQTFGGMLEFDGWAYAPLYARDVAYVRPNTDLDAVEVRAAFPDWEVTMEPDGLIAIAAPAGLPVKDAVTDWLLEHQIFHEGVRDARNVKRRNIKELPAGFLNDLVAKYTRYAASRVRDRHSGAIARLIGDPDDLAGTVALWVMESIAAFDATRGVPFGAWLTQQLPNRLMDLNRASFGRTAADAEMVRAREIEAFEVEHGRVPSKDELRQRMGLSREEMARKERDLANLRGLRATAPIETGPDAPELPVVDLSANPEADMLNLELMQQVSRALLASSAQWDDDGRPVYMRRLGFLIVYLMHWQEWTKGDLTAMAGKASRSVAEEVDAVQLMLAERLSDLREGRAPIRLNPTPIL